MSRFTFLTSVFILLVGSNLYGQESLEDILSQSTRQSRYKIEVDITDNEGNRSSIPIAIFKGEQEGPTVTVLAGVHGYEYPPIIACQDLIQEIDTDSIVGTIIIIPLANPNSFYSRTPFINPQDDLNLNRVFPGNAAGTVTEKTAHFITEKVIAHSDVFIDIHGGDANEDLLPFVCYYNNPAKAEQTRLARTLCETSGFEYVVSYDYTLSDDQPAKYAFKQAVQDGKVALSIECGGLGNIGAGEIHKIKSAVYQMLDKLNVYPSSEIVNNEYIHFNRQVYLKSSKKGIFQSHLAAGDKVESGDIIGYIKDVFGQKLEEVLSPQDGIVLYKIGTPPVNIGETVFCIGFTQSED